MDQRVIELLAEAVELMRQQQHQQQQQQPCAAPETEPKVRKVARMLDIVARLPERFTLVEGGFAYIAYTGRRLVKVVLPETLREAAPEDLRDTLFVFSVDLMERPDGRRFTSVRGRPIDQDEALKRLTLRPEMVRPLAEELVRLPGISWCRNGTAEVLEEMAVSPGD